MSNQALFAVLEQDCDAHALHVGLDVVPEDDPAARRLLQCAQGALHRWPEVFPGFSARVDCRDGRERITGHVRVFTDGRVDLDLRPSTVARWATQTLSEFSLARPPRFFKDGRPLRDHVRA